MPPHQTIPTSDTVRETAGRCRDHAIAVVQDTTGDALAGACPDASIAVLRDAFSDKEAVGPPVASTRSVLSLLRGYWYAFQEWRERGKLRVRLHDLSIRELMDIGLTPGDVDRIVAERTIERLRDGRLSRGMM